MAKKRRTIKKRYKTTTKRLKRKTKHTEDLKLVIFLGAVAIIILVLAKTSLKENHSYKVMIKDVTPQQIGETNTYHFYYTVSNPTNVALDCNVIVEISGKPYINKVSLEPNQELYTMTSVEIPSGESSIKITSACK